jgi:uncharacterized protein (TIGR02145 family)
MSNALASGQPYVKVTDIGTQSNEITVSLKRRVARFDVIADGIDITNVSISNAAPTGKVLDHADNVLAPGVGGLTYTIQGSALANTGTSFYLYPTTLGAGSTGTVITVTANNNTYSIPLAASQPIDANKLYRIMVTQSATGSDLTFKLVVADWTDADNLPTFEEGSVVAGFNPVVSSSQGVSINNYSVDYSDATAAASVQLYYASTSNVKPQAEVVALHGTHAEAISVGISNPVAVTYTSGYMSTVTITMPKTTVPVDLEVRLTGNGGDAQTVKVISVPDYTDPRYEIEAGIKPVLKNGIYWAPINVGATKQIPLPYQTALTVPNTAYTGFVFQWGRNVGFDLETLSTWQKQVGPVTLQQAEAGGEYADKYITVTNTANNNANYNWIVPDATLWSGERVQGPCPDGWMLPALDLYVPLIQEYDRTASIIPSANTTQGVLKLMRLPNDGGTDYIYFPAVGYINLSGSGITPALNQNGTYSSYWTSTAGTTNMSPFGLIKCDNTANTTRPTGEIVPQYWGLPVRCIQK